MSNLILCKENLSSMPFYLESASKHIYSMEELYYYIKANPYLAAWDIMKEEFCIWMEENNFHKNLIKELRELMTNGSKQTDFLRRVIKNETYYNQQEKQELIHVLNEMENKSAIECLKLKADKWMENKKYICAMKEYKSILSSENIKTLSADIIGNIWNNLGSAYAELFFYEEAVWCYKKAYAYNNNPKSLNAMEKAKKNADTIDRELLEASGFKTSLSQEYDQLLTEWKQEYIKMADLRDWSIG